MFFPHQSGFHHSVVHSVVHICTVQIILWVFFSVQLALLFLKWHKRGWLEEEGMGEDEG